MMEYNLNYLQSLINERIEENLHLDYKAAGALDKVNVNKTKESISKDVAAFANADGGIIIYGISENKAFKHIPNAIDPIDRNIISKEWLEQIIQSSIQPRINGILIYPIEIESNLNKVVYVVDVPKSNTAHQSNDLRYYRRHNFNILPMYDYEIRDILNRVNHPLIGLEFEIVLKGSYSISIWARNNGNVMAQYVHCVINLPSKALHSNDDFFNNENVEFSASNTVRDIVDFKGTPYATTPVYGPTRYVPILPRLNIKLDFDLPQLDEFYHENEQSIEWEIFVDNAEPIKGRIKLQDIPVERKGFFNPIG